MRIMIAAVGQKIAPPLLFRPVGELHSCAILATRVACSSSVHEARDGAAKADHYDPRRMNSIARICPLLSVLAVPTTSEPVRATRRRDDPETAHEQVSFRKVYVVACVLPPSHSDLLHEQCSAPQPIRLPQLHDLRRMIQTPYTGGDHAPEEDKCRDHRG